MNPAESSPLYPLDGDTDCTIRTGDGVLFGLHRALLKRVSPVFSDMFVLGNPIPDAAPGEHIC
jgi:BTB/POZ domain